MGAGGGGAFVIAAGGGGALQPGKVHDEANRPRRQSDEKRRTAPDIGARIGAACASGRACFWWSTHVGELEFPRRTSAGLSGGTVFDRMPARTPMCGVLREIKNVKQEREAGARRWFESDGFDLVVWFDVRGRMTGFQICYDLGRGERALTWRARGGFAHSVVDGGEDTPLKNMTPVLLPDGEVPWRELTRRFEERSGSLEPALRELVRVKLDGRRKARE
jgi:hypothetical protein